MDAIIVSWIAISIGLVAYPIALWATRRKDAVTPATRWVVRGVAVVLPLAVWKMAPPGAHPPGDANLDLIYSAAYSVLALFLSGYLFERTHIRHTNRHPK